LSADADLEWVMLDSTVVRAHACAGGAKPRLFPWAAFSSKIHAAADALGNPLRFQLTAGQKGDAPRAPDLIDGIDAKAVLADRADDSDALLERIKAKSANAIIPPNPTRSGRRQTDWWLYKERHKIEVMFGLLKHHRRVFARFDKLAKRYLAFVHFAAACILLR
jgi:transposase